MDRIALLNSAALITAAFAGNDRCQVDDVPRVLRETFETLKQLAEGTEPVAEILETTKPIPATTPRKSLANPDHIISMIDGKPYKTLRRHITRHGYTPESYRETFELKSDYPMVSESYSKVRRDMALQHGLGTKANRGA